MDSKHHQRDPAWYEDYHSPALESATEFSDVYLDAAFAEIRVRLNAIRLCDKPILSKAVTDSQLISLQHLLPELEHADGQGADEAEEGQWDWDESLVVDQQADPGGLSDRWSEELTKLNYEDLYQELEQDALSFNEPAIAQLLQSLNTGALKTTQSTFAQGMDQNATEHELANTPELPVCEVSFHPELTELEAVNRDSASDHVTTKIDNVVFQFVEELSAEHEQLSQTSFVLVEDDSESKTFDDDAPDGTRFKFNAIDDTEPMVAEEATEVSAAESQTSDRDVEQFPQVSRLPADQAPMAIQTGSELLQVDAQSVAQALVEMYLENERILNEHREEQQQAQLKQSRQLWLIGAAACTAVTVMCAAIFFYVKTSNMHAAQKVPSVAVAPMAPTTNMPAYRSVNVAPTNTNTDGKNGKLSGEVRSSFTPTVNAVVAAEAAHLANSVGADEFDYFDKSIYEPDSYADADTEYYPEAEGGNSVVIEQRKADISPHELAYAQWQAGDIAAAKQAYETILKANSKDTEALVGLGSMSQQKGNNAVAIDYLVRAVKTQPDHAYALAALASLSTSKNRQQLESDLMQLAKDNPGVAELPFILGNWYARDKRWNDAQQAYFDAFNRNANSADYAFNLAIALDQIGKAASAEGFYRKAIALAPGSNTHFDIKLARARADLLRKNLNATAATP